MAVEFCDPGLATGSNDGTSWEDAYNTLQGGIDNLGAGNELWVKGRTVTLSARIDFDNASGMIIYGGFDVALTGTSGSVAGRDLPTDITVLDGGATYQGGYVNNQEYTIDGFKFYDGTGSLGSGLQCYLTSGTVKISNCIFDGNNGATGGGLYASGGGLIDIDDCVFTDNVGSSNGGAFYLSSTDGTMDNCSLSGNSSSSGWGAGGIAGSGYTLSMTDCEVTNNSTSAYNGASLGASTSAIECVRVKINGHTGGSVGGGVRCTGSTTTWVNCVITGNSCTYGGGLYLSGGTNTITDCTIADNTAGTGGSIRNTGGANTTVYNSQIWGNSTAIANAATMALYYCNYDSTWSGTGSNNINADPDFVGSGDDPYDLNSATASVDAADAGATNYPATDFLGRSRVDVTGVVNTGAGTPDYSDIGAYEYQPPVTDVEVYGAILMGY